MCLSKLSRNSLQVLPENQDVGPCFGPLVSLRRTCLTPGAVPEQAPPWRQGTTRDATMDAPAPQPNTGFAQAEGVPSLEARVRSQLRG